MPDPNTEHGLRVQLATALRERDEAREEADKQRARRNICQQDRNAYELQNDALRTALTDIVTLCMDVPATEDWRKAVGDKARAALFGPPAWETK